MLHQLHIHDFVIVKQLALSFQPGLSIVTGETGAGKSILVDALSLVLGDRADSDMVSPHAEQATIQAYFALSAANRTWLAEQGLELSEDAQHCELKRIISRNGRSRAFIHGQAVKVQLLAAFGERLVDIHSQHAHQSLVRQETQRRLLDNALSEPQLVNQVATAWQRWKQTQRALRELGGQATDREARLSLLRYQVEELEQLELDAEQIENLKDEQRRLSHAGRLLENAERAQFQLDDENGIVSALQHSMRELDSVSTYDERLQPIIELLNNALIQAEEANSELRHYVASLEMDPARLDWIDNYFAELQNIARKHQTSIEQLPQTLAELRSQLDALEHHEQRAANLETELARSLRHYQDCAAKLSAQRQQAAQTLAQAITDNMRQLGLPSGQLAIEVRYQPEQAPIEHGLDHIEFVVSTNPGQPLKPLSKVASGGELSRISLAIQVITAQSSGVGMLVFDEVDVGVGGGVAEIVGQRLAALGKQRQVLCITHLPQVAAYGHQHLQVKKTSQTDHTQTAIQLLNEEQRVQEIARMLGGLEITEHTLAHAREMLMLSAPGFTLADPA